jgi:hypothetical protein
MKLRKAIKMAAAAAVVGATPLMVQAAPPGAMGSYTGDSNGVITYTCTTNAAYTCDTANAISEGGFYMVTVHGTNGDTFIDTVIYDDLAAEGEGVMSSQSVVGHEDNAINNGGIYSTMNVNELIVDGATANFDATTTISTGGYLQASALGEQDVQIDQNITNGAFSSGFGWTHGNVTGGTPGDAYETFNITHSTTDNSEFTDTFQMLETKVDGVDSTGLASKQLSSKSQVIAGGGVPGESIEQYFVLNEASGAAVAAGSYVAGSSTNTITFSAGDTVTALTLDQDLAGVDASFSLSDIANETTSAGDGFDVFGSAAQSAVTVTMTDTNNSSPFLDFP